jgi:hypothetical protein
MMGAIVLSREHDLSPHNAIRPPAYFARFRSNFAAPIHIRGDELFIVTQSPNNASDSGLGYWDPQFGTKWPLLAYSVPRRCLSRLATSPLERIWMVDGQLRSAPHAGFTADMLQAVPPFRNASVEVGPVHRVMLLRSAPTLKHLVSLLSCVVCCALPDAAQLRGRDVHGRLLRRQRANTGVRLDQRHVHDVLLHDRSDCHAA